MKIHGYTESGSIRVTIDGQEMTVPDDMGNRDRQMIAEWEAEGNTIPPYVAPSPVIPDSVSARQFKLQLYISELLDDVETWIAAQDRTVQIAYENSSTFVRGEPMMQQGFTDLGFTTEQINQFFLAAAQL